MTIDERARQAARDLNQAVAEADLMLFEAGIPGQRERLERDDRSGARLSGRLVFAGAFVAATVVVLAAVAIMGRSYLPGGPEIETDAANTAPIPTPEGDPITTTIAPDTEDDPADVDLIAPELTIVYPADGAVFEGKEQKEVVFSGTVDPGARVVASGLFDTTVEPDGTWSIMMVLQPGDTVASFVAIDENGVETERSITVTYIPDQPEVTSTTMPVAEDPQDSERPAEDPDSGVDHTFSASARHGESSEDAPFDVYEGTATPGATITITSSYGGGQAVAGPDGRWSVRVKFTDPPLGETIIVTARDEFSERALKLGFTYKGES